MGLEAPSHWVIIALVVLVLFGYKKLPEMSRSVGRSLRIFKTEIKGMSEDDSAREAVADPTVTAPSTPPVAATPVNPVPVPPTVTAVPPLVPPVAVNEIPQEAPKQQAQA